MKKFWRNHWYSPGYMSIDCVFTYGRVNGLNEDEVLRISEFFLRSGVKYRLFEPQILSSDEYLRATIGLIRESLSKTDEFIGKNTIRSFTFAPHDCGIHIPNLSTTIPLPGEKGIEMVRCPIEAQIDENTIYYYFDIFFDPKFHIEIEIVSNSDIWWPDLLALAPEGASRVREHLDIPFDNRPYSYRITPRLNSFLRDMKAFATNFEHTAGYVTPNDYCTQDGVLLDGKIIYQEDVDEGRVVPPNEYREMDPETIEKLKRYDLL